MTETLKDVTAERDQLQRAFDEAEDALAAAKAENERLRAQAAAAGRPAGVTAAQHTFQLSQGDLADLERNGWISVGGKVMTVADVRSALADTPQKDLEIVEPKNPQVPVPVEPTNVRGFDYVWPSVRRGEIDPAVAGTPGISGPAAKSESKG